MSVKDFDKFWEEKNGKKEAKEVRIEGQVWKLKPELPATAMLTAIRMEQMDDHEDLEVDEVIEVYDALLAEKTGKDLLNSGVGFIKLFSLTGYLMNEVYDFDVEEAAEGAEEEGNQI